ncbi:hypothetical protein CBR_g49136 [Chara braunii]|uniref:Uncharacterized protein n=1 Tax=Chara braunii TaxID=69332 RepID=A0A388K4T2_CHABU|nr:hypothetical protein CBR_g49136 [Chara braunii]|eukprot:GBG65064.1 hypothetical protein CBR_g49136 [Chara braunii]
MCCSELAVEGWREWAAAGQGEREGSGGGWGALGVAAVGRVEWELGAWWQRCEWRGSWAAAGRRGGVGGWRDAGKQELRVDQRYGRHSSRQ